MAVAEVSQEEKYKELWLEAKAKNADANKAVLESRKQVKSAQDAQAAAEEKAAEAEALASQVSDLEAGLSLCSKQNADLAKKLKKAESKIAAAEKIAAGIAELG